ncbi:MAG: ABC transporter permease [Saprospiraceae bacterium]|nr:ABC transporter permease [Saprospiraceae bacterium]
MASIVFAVVLCVLMDSVKKGLLDRMKENIVSIYSGYVQVQQNGFWENRTLEQSFKPTKQLLQYLSGHHEIVSVIPRLESFILVASDDYAKGTLIVGIDPEMEARHGDLSDKIISGTYLSVGDRAALITEGLAGYLRLGAGDTIVLLGQGYHGATAVGKYLIKGVVKFGSPELNEGLVYLPLQESQSLFAADERITALVLDLQDIDLSHQVANELSEDLGHQYEVMSWQEMSPELDQFIKGEETENVIFQIILYLLIAFGIFGTILMMTLEREREFGILVAIGMKKHFLSSMVILENLMIALLGSLGGLLLSFPATFYFFRYPIPLKGKLAEAYENFGIEPIFYFSIDPEIFYSQAIIVLLLASLLSFFPVLKVGALHPVNAMRK